MENYRLILEKFTPTIENVVQMLLELQESEKQNYLTTDALMAVVDYTTLPLSVIIQIIESNPQFSTQPKGQFVIQVCKSSMCVNKESDRIVSVILNHYEIETIGACSKDGLISVEYYDCVGQCRQGSAVRINGFYLEKVKAINIIPKIDEFIKNSEHY